MSAHSNAVLAVMVSLMLFSFTCGIRTGTGGGSFLPQLSPPYRHDGGQYGGQYGGSQLPPGRLPALRSRGGSRPANHSPTGHSPTPGQYASWGAGSAEDTWEDDVDDLLEWTRTLE